MKQRLSANFVLGIAEQDFYENESYSGVGK